MQNFTIIEGKQSPYYNHFDDYEFESFIVSDTRMMGVLAMKAKLRATDGSGAVQHLLMHLDFSEYGIDEYIEYFHESDRTADMDNFMEDDWETIYSGLGGELREMEIPVALYHINSAYNIFCAKKENTDDDGLMEFREMVGLKMKQLWGKYVGSPYAKSCYDAITPEDSIPYIAAASKPRLTENEVINYFVMRLADGDTEGIRYLSDMSPAVLKATSIYQNGIQTLMRNTIEYEDAGNCVAKSLTMTSDSYYFYAAEIGLDKSSSEHMAFRISDYREIDAYGVSEFEAALQLKHAEYIAVYTIHEHNMYFDIDRIPSVKNSKPAELPSGELRLRYYDDNVHVDSTDYILDYDVYGAYLVTDMGELLIMSTTAENATQMEMDVLAEYPPEVLELQDRYRFDTQVFQTFAYTEDKLFSDMLESDEDE